MANPSDSSHAKHFVSTQKCDWQIYSQRSHPYIPIQNDLFHELIVPPLGVRHGLSAGLSPE